jgi:uncharacterized protein (DUF934 family)
MPLLKGDRFTKDSWIRIDGDADLPFAGDILVPFARLLQNWGEIARHPGLVGVVFPNSERAEALQSFLGRLSLIVLPFPAFTDGRAYSIGRQLRDLGFSGELRAAGNVLPDQLQFMLQVGFDAFEVPDRFPESVWQKAARSMSVSYQPVPGARNVWLARHGEPGGDRDDQDPWFEQPHAG